jgi:hypothetical protein
MSCLNAYGKRLQEGGVAPAAAPVRVLNKAAVRQEILAAQATVGGDQHTAQWSAM